MLTKKRVICPIHGDIGSDFGVDSAEVIRFSIRLEETYCLLCWQDFLRKHIQPCSFLEE